MARSPGRAPAFARSFFGRNLDPSDPALSHRPRWDSTAALKGMLTADLRAEIARAGAPDVLATMPADSARWDPLARAQWLEMTTLLPGYILSSQGDRMLMAHSVEGRFPFLDPGVVELAAALPAWHKLCGLDEKHVLKRAFADLVPDEIVHRPKQPYRAPDAAAFFGPDQPDWVREVTSERALEEAGVFDPALVSGLVAKCERSAGRTLGNTDNMRALAVLSTQLLHDGFVVGNDWAAAERALPDAEVAVDLLDNHGSQS
jgi:asparagine synthase (glutamine-hydrolysing)